MKRDVILDRLATACALALFSVVFLLIAWAGSEVFAAAIRAGGA